MPLDTKRKLLIRRVVIWIEFLIAAAFLGYGVFMVAYGVRSGQHDTRHGGMYLIFFGLMNIVYGGSFFIAALGLGLGRRFGWWFQIFPAVPTAWVLWAVLKSIA